jgi:hypothetical protein
MPKKHPSSDEWYTPPEIIENVRNILGTIDLDPASCEIAQKTVKAGTYWKIDEDGYHREWFGKVFINPPYLADKLGKYGESKKTTATKYWMEKALDQIATNPNVIEIIMLVNRSDASWYYDLIPDFDAYYQKRGRINFICGNPDPDLVRDSPRYSNDFLYLGKYPEHFYICAKCSWGDNVPGSFFKKNRQITETC